MENTTKNEMGMIDYLNKHKIKYLPVALTWENGKKVFLAKLGNRYNFNKSHLDKYDFETCQKYYKMYGKYSQYIIIYCNEVHQLDIDDDTDTWKEGFKLADEFNFKYPYFLSVSKNMPHYFMQFAFREKSCSEIPVAHDLLYNHFSYAKKDTIVYNANALIQEVKFTSKKKEELKAVEALVEVAVKPEEVQTDATISTFERSILDNISSDNYNRYPDWTKFIWAVKYSFQDYETALDIANFYSSKLDNYISKEDVKAHFDKATQQRIGWSYLQRLSKESNKTAHFNILASHQDNIHSSADYDLALLAEKYLINDNIIKIKEASDPTPVYSYYHFDKPYWSKADMEKLMREVIRALLEFYTNQYLKVISIMQSNLNFADKKLIAEKEDLDKIVAKLKSTYHQKNIVEQFKVLKLHTSSIDFDTYKPYYFCFTNCAFNLETNQPVEVQRHHYISQTTGYDYVEPTEEQVKTITDIFHMIFPEEFINSRNCYASVMRCMMNGILQEKFILANGCGRNGKGLLNHLMKKMLGPQYFYKGSVSSITEKLKDGANPALANMNKARTSVYTEPNDNDVLNLGVAKALTGEGEFNVRGLYSSITKMVLMAIQVLECNKKPKIDARIDESIVGRFVNIMFPCTFTDDPNKLSLPYHFPINKEFKKPEFLEEHKCALFKMLLNYTYTDVFVPDSIRQATFDYLCETDDFTEWLDRHYTVVQTKSKIDKSYKIKFKEMVDHYKANFLKEGSKEYRKTSMDTFLKKLKENIKWKEIVNECYSHKKTREWIGIKRIYEADDDDDDDVDANPKYKKITIPTSNSTHQQVLVNYEEKAFYVEDEANPNLLKPVGYIDDKGAYVFYDEKY